MKEDIERTIDTARELDKPKSLQERTNLRNLRKNIFPDPLNDRKSQIPPTKLLDQVFTIINNNTVRGHSTGNIYQANFLTTGRIKPGVVVIGAVKGNIAYVVQPEEGIRLKPNETDSYIPKPAKRKEVLTLSINIGFTG